MSDHRIERDSMGEVRVPANAYYGAQTQRAVENFPISGWPLPAELICAMGLVKYACAIANRDLGKLAGSGKNPLDDRQVEALLARVLLALNPLEPPLKPLERCMLFCGTLRLPILFCAALRLAPAALRFALLIVGLVAREPPAPAPTLRLPAPAVCAVAPARFPPPAWLRVVDPENLFAVALLEYGAAPRCWEL